MADVAGAMVHVGMEPHGRASVFGANSPEWMIAMQVSLPGFQPRPDVLVVLGARGWGVLGGL